MSDVNQFGKKDEIRQWWADAPMTYAEDHGATEYQAEGGEREQTTLGSRRFFDRADERFYSWNAPLHAGDEHFGRIFDYQRYRGRPVLEVGCGMGCMAMNWASRGARMTAVDLNPVAIAQTRRRFELYDLVGDIREADAERLPFADDSFAFAYSWGVLHHTPDTARTIQELLRVLEPGGQVGVMLYHRQSFLYRYCIAFMEGLVNMERRFVDELGLASRYGDGARQEGNPHTWPVTVDEVHRDLFRGFSNVQVRILGTDVPNVLDVWCPGLGSRRMPLAFKKALARRWGWSLWITGVKPGQAEFTS